MVSTRHHPRPFPEPATPTSTRSSATDPASRLSLSASPPPNKAVGPLAGASQKRRSHRKSTAWPTSSATGAFVHQVPPLLVVWMCVSLPLVLWDTGYVLLRPRTMPGGSLHWPVWAPYELYGTVDYVYGWPAWNGHVGFTAAQGTLNLAETAMYLYYLAVVWRHDLGGLFAGRAGSVSAFLRGSEACTVSGPGVATAVVVLFASAVMTLSKTVLYWLNEYFSGFANIGHNNLSNLILLWIIPNGLWLVFPSYMVFVLGGEIVAGLNGSRPVKDD